MDPKKGMGILIMQGKDYLSFILTENSRVADFLIGTSDGMSGYVKSHDDSEFALFYKMLSHSDLATFGKATRKNSLDKNYLYYIKESDMAEIEKKTERPFQTAHQSCIGLKKEFYEIADLPDPRDVDPYLVNDYMNVYLVNESVNFFESEYTQQVFEKLGKTVGGREWDFENLDVSLSEMGDFTPIPLHCAVHGLGMKQDSEFYKLRHHMFRGDTFILLFERTPSGKNNLFVVLSKNPAFFSIVDDLDARYVNRMEKQIDFKNGLAVFEQQNVDGVKARPLIKTESDRLVRNGQDAWRTRLSEEMMAYNQDNKVFCPFTFIEADFYELGALFKASHIKAFSDPKTEENEKFDINNGLLLSANADALFDRHLITVNEKKELEYSFLLKGETKLLSQLRLNQPIFETILNDKRMKYLKYHRECFFEEESKRMKGDFSDNSSIRNEAFDSCK